MLAVNSPSNLRMLSARRSILLGVLAASHLGVSVGRAQTAQPPVYKGCYVGDKTGTVYRVDDPSNGYPAAGGFPNSSKQSSGCASKNDQSFLWNQTGPQGPIGPIGASGQKGDAGVAGPIGAPGPTGPQGSQGAAGSVGATGPKGDAGSKGDPGSAGAVGPQGNPGTKGDAGNAGPIGP